MKNINSLIDGTNIKLTAARKSILEVLVDSSKPLCYEDIKDKISMDKATFYRNITKFEDEHIINSFESNDKKRYFEIDKICQEFNHAPYGDVAIFLSKDVVLKDHSKVQYKKYKMPPAVQRGKCTSCDKPAVEMLKLPMLPELTIIPSANIPTGDFLPDPSMHIFYHRRINDMHDELPKISGFIKSQVLLGGKILSAIFKR